MRCLRGGALVYPLVEDGLRILLLRLQVEPAVGGGEVWCLFEAPQALKNHHYLLRQEPGIMACIHVENHPQPRVLL